MRVTVGWLKLNHGARDAFMRDIAQPFAAATRAEEGCLFFEMTASADDPDIVVIAQSFRDAAAHAAHTASLYEADLRRDLETIGDQGRFSQSRHKRSLVARQSDIPDQVGMIQ